MSAYKKILAIKEPTVILFNKCKSKYISEFPELNNYSDDDIVKKLCEIYLMVG